MARNLKNKTAVKEKSKAPETMAQVHVTKEYCEDRSVNNWRARQTQTLQDASEGSGRRCRRPRKNGEKQG